MYLNATILAQIINFWITYLFLHFIFFKPAVKMLMRKSAMKRALRDDLKYKEAVLAHLQEKKKQHAHDFKTHLTQTYALKKYEEPLLPTLQGIELSGDDISSTVEKSSSLLTEKVPDAF